MSALVAVAAGGAAGSMLRYLFGIQIGRWLGGRDHTTILHGKRAYVAKRAAQGRTLRGV